MHSDVNGSHPIDFAVCGSLSARKKKTPSAIRVKVIMIIEINNRIFRPALSTKSEPAKVAMRCTTPTMIVEMSESRLVFAA